MTGFVTDNEDLNNIGDNNLGLDSLTNRAEPPINSISSDYNTPDAAENLEGLELREESPVGLESLVEDNFITLQVSASLLESGKSCPQDVRVKAYPPR